MRTILLSTTATAALLFALSGAIAQQEKPGQSSDQPRATQSQQAPASAGERRGAQQTDRKDRARGGDTTGQMNRDESPPSRAAPAGSDRNQGQAQQRDERGSQTGAQSQGRQDSQRQGQSQTEQRAQERPAATDRGSRGDRERRDTTTGQGGRSDQGAAQDRASPSRTDRGTAQDRTAPRRTDQGTGTRDRAGARDTGTTRTETSTQRGESVQLSDEQRGRVVQRLTRETSETSVRANFNVSVGVGVPRSVRVRELPSDIIGIVPQYRGFSYVVVRDEIVIVHPRTRKIVTVIPKSGSVTTGARTPSSARLTLTEEQRRKIKQHALGSGRRVSERVQLRVGESLPQTIELWEFPAEVYAELPDIRRYRYVVIEDDVALVDPTEHRIVEVID